MHQKIEKSELFFWYSCLHAYQKTDLPYFLFSVFIFYFSSFLLFLVSFLSYLFYHNHLPRQEHTQVIQSFILESVLYLSTLLNYP